MVAIRLSLNGEETSVDAPVTASLLEVLREAGLTGTKEGCQIGVCGLCSVLVDDLPMSSCLLLAPCVEGRDVWTVEGLAAARPQLTGRFAAAEAMQCGICTPGQVVMAAAAEGDADRPGRTDAGYLDGNLCRCTGYSTILEALRGAGGGSDRGDG
jgi:carbon-monoxide dehydrogenase small subunit